jgi:hypothetical protein
VSESTGEPKHSSHISGDFTSLKASSSLDLRLLDRGLNSVGNASLLSRIYLLLASEIAS